MKPSLHVQILTFNTQCLLGGTGVALLTSLLCVKDRPRSIGLCLRYRCSRLAIPLRGPNFLLTADKPVDVVVCNRLGDLCLDAGKSIAGRTLRAEFHCSEASSRDPLAVHLVNRAPKEHLDF